MMADYPAHGTLDWDTPLREYMDNRFAATPDYVDPSDLLYIFDPELNSYNFKESNTRKWRRAAGRAMTSQIAEISVIGDSTTTGAISTVGPTYDRLNAWPMHMGLELARHGLPKAGTGMVRLNDAGDTDARWVKSTGGTAWNNARKTYSYASANGATATFTTDVAGDRATVGYFDDNTGATFTVSVAGGSDQTVTMNGGIGWKKVTFNGAISVGQTVLITKTSGAFIYIRGAGVWSSTGGLIVNNLSQGGSKAFGTGVSDTDNEYWQDASDTHTLGQVYAAPTMSLTVPDLVIIEVGANDVDLDVSPANIVTALTDVRERYVDSDFILVGSWQKAAVSDADHEAYVAALYGLADTLDVPLVDHRARLGTWDQIVAAGLNGDSSAHLKVEAFADLGRNIGMLLAA